ncbi:MAG TPA: DUF1643 domain-containing protein [Clostridia bacterium]
MLWMYEKSADNTSRFVLGTRGVNSLACFGINPSTAAPDALDNTLKSVERIARINHFDSWIMFNVYPQRATNPNDLHAEMDPELHRLNLMHIDQVLAEFRPVLWAAWGTLIHKRAYLPACLLDIDEVVKCHPDCRWLTFGKRSKDGHPHHPLYLNSQAEADNFAIIEYTRSMTDFNKRR